MGRYMGTYTETYGFCDWQHIKNTIINAWELADTIADHHKIDDQDILDIINNNKKARTIAHKIDTNARLREDLAEKDYELTTEKQKNQETCNHHCCCCRCKGCQ